MLYQTRTVDWCSHLDNLPSLSLSLALSAASVMCELSLRLTREVRSVASLQKQVNCFLSALTCLRLIRPEFSWIVQPVGGATVRTYCVTRLSYDRCYCTAVATH